MLWPLDAVRLFAGPVSEASLSEPISMATQHSKNPTPIINGIGGRLSLSLSLYPTPPPHPPLHNSIHPPLPTPWRCSGSPFPASTGDRIYFTEFGGERIKNLTRCAAGGYQCANVKIAAPGCLNAPGRNYSGDTNSCDCGCDV